MRRLVASSLCALVVAASGCGLKGPLYLPDKTGEVVIRPAPAASPPATPVEPATSPPAQSPAIPAAPPPPQALPSGSATRG
jgi:predicted small lipoprotein YifL